LPCPSSCVYNQLQNKNHRCQCKQMHGNYFRITTALCHLMAILWHKSVSLRFHCVSRVRKFSVLRKIKESICQAEYKGNRSDMTTWWRDKHAASLSLMTSIDSPDASSMPCHKYAYSDCLSWSPMRVVVSCICWLNNLGSSDEPTDTLKNNVLWL